MKEILKTLILGFHERDLPAVVPRAFKFPEFPPAIRKVHVLMGMRRTGKTWMLFQEMQAFLKLGLPKEKILYLNFEDDRLSQFRTADFQLILDAYFDIYPQYSKSKDLAFFFDEIHIIRGWEKFIRRLLDQESMKLFVTGSSAHMLSKEIATTLHGRSWSQEVFPCNFREVLSFKNVSIPKQYGAKTASLLRHLAEEFLTFGGFPESLYLVKELHTPLLQNYIDSVIFRDIIDRYQIKNAHMVKRFLLYCLSQPATLISINKVFNHFKSLGESVGKNSLFEYLSYFEDAYALFAISIFNFSEKVRQVNPKKIYTIDPGLISAYSIKPQFDKAARLENAVFNHLRRQTKEIFYYKTQQQKEVDFVTISSRGELSLIQVCYLMNDEKTRQREVSALLEASSELNLNHATIITSDYEETIQEQGLKIECIPFWKL